MRLPLIFAVVLAALLPSAARAHPHVFVNMRSEIVYEGAVPVAIRHAWTFDEMFSAFATQGLDTNGDGVFSREELADLAETNVTSLREFDFFTFGEGGGQDLRFEQPRDYWLDHANSVLTLNFTLPITGAQQTADGQSLRVQVYDPTYFVAFELQQEQPALLAGAPAGCRVDAQRPEPEEVFGGAGEKLNESFFDNLDPETGFGEKLASTFTVRCGAEAEAFAAGAERRAETHPAGQPGVADRINRAQQIAEAAPLEEAQTPPAATDPAPAAGSSGALGAFGIVRPDGGGGSTGGVFGWINARQSDFYRQMSAALTNSRNDGSGSMMLAVLAFAYGVFHAAGPGHGKAVISSYLVATGETLRRGILLSFAAAAAQAVTAIAAVVILAWILGRTSQALGLASWWLEAASYALIAALGAVLFWRKGRAFIRTATGRGAAADCGTDCGHAHGPDIADLGGTFDWRRAAAAVLAIGMRPCTGALVILVFALAQGMLWTGIAATFAMALGTAMTVAAIAALAVWAKNLALQLASSGSGTGVLAVRGLEAAAGLALLLFGIGLLSAFLATGIPGG